MDQIAVVILNYNGKKLLEQFLPIVLKYSPYPVVVADNQSTDQSLNFLQEEFPEVRTIALPENYGFSKGYNQALRQIKAKYYVLLNSDVEVTPNWLQPMLDLLENNPTIAACQPKILSYHQKDTFEYAGAAGGFIDFLGYPFCRGRLFTTLEKDAGQYDQPMPIFWATGACLFIRSEVYWEAGGLDDDFFAHLEEIDLCWRIHQLKYHVYCLPESKVYHVGGGTLAYDNPRKNYLNFRNSLLMLYKNSNNQELLFKLPVKLILDWVAALKFLAEGNFRSFLTIYQAHFYFMRNFKYWYRKKKAWKIKTGEISTILRKLVVFEYFFKKKRTFSQLKF